VNRFRTVGVKLTLALAGLVAGALAIVYVAVVPSLENRLIDARLDQLERTAAIVAEDIETLEEQGLTLDRIASFESDQRGVRVVVYDHLDENPIFLRVLADSQDVDKPLARDAVAIRAAERQQVERDIVRRQGTDFAEVAVPFRGVEILLLSTPIEDTLSTVSLVERRLLLTALVALLAAAGVGFALARLHARRIHRLERAAERIAAGRFEEPVVDGGADELGQLAVAFDDMRKRLSALERARREFIANASHELRTPIFALGGHLELLTDDDMDEATRREFLVGMRQQVERLTKLATDLLDLSRLDAGRLRVELTPVDLSDVAARLVGEFSGVGRGSDHVLVAGGDDRTLALADEERVRQIGGILLENALLHTPPGTEVRLLTSRDGDAAELRVEDDGPGIPPGDQEQVFDRFYRGDGAVAAGSGLGLAIARELATLMGGEVDLESRPGRTVFTLRLPAARAPALDREPVLAG
jgi:two-component system OmpR family sensor kinase